ncbi:flagella synthesis protein FlgN [Dyella sp. OK004]|uniref:flagella synthesis protein FlgN n=1 Tax=Dyella sp. OK004 TaxID=1855292 RepID=UPI0008EB9EDC|nr:flagellar protein FlgN [Dyella sp. OK004]SFR87204.1 flagella synthesis protein FlgN [Dyella sp. OK004]
MNYGLHAEMESALTAVIGDMREAVTQLAAALAAERSALEQADAEALHLAGTAKQAQMERLEQLDGERVQLLRAIAAPAPAQGAAWSEVVAALADCQRANQYNGQVVGQRLRQVRQALSVLTGGSESTLYGPAGTLHTDHRQQSLAEA